MYSETLTSVWIDSNLFARPQRFFDVAFLDALNTQITETDAHCIVVDLHCAHSLLAALFAD